MRSRSWRQIAVASLVLSCGVADRMQGPQPTHLLSRPALSEAGADPSPVGIGGSYTLTAGGIKITAVRLAATGIQTPSGIPVRVRVSGAITRTATPGLLQFCATPGWDQLCQTVWADIVAETPIPPSGLSFWPGAAAAQMTWDGGDPVMPDPGSTTALEGLSGSELWAGRTAWSCMYVYRDPVDYHLIQGDCFTFGGGYTFTVAPNDGKPVSGNGGSGGGGGGGGAGDSTGGPTLTLAANPTQLGPGGGDVVFTASATRETSFEISGWHWVPDSISTVVADTTGPMATASAAQGTAVAGSEMYALPGGRPDGSGLYLIRPAGTTGGGSGPSLSAPAGAVPVSAASECGGADSVCSLTVSQAGTMVVVAQVDGELLSAAAHLDLGETVPPQLALDCPSGVVRGAEITCAASYTPSSATMVITGWRFQPDDPHLGLIQRSTGEDQGTWSGTMAASGTVTVSATLNGQAGETSQHVAVTDRPPLAVQFDPPAPSDNSDMSERPYQAAGEEGLFHIGHIHVADYAIELPGNVDVIPAGPNGGLAYFTANPYQPRWAVHINLSQLDPNSDLAHLQRESSPAYESTVSCLRSQLPSLIGPIEEHEGTTMHPKSHAGRYASKFNELAGPAMERLVVQQDLRGAVDAALEPVVRAAGEESGKADLDFRPALCQLTLFPAPR